MDFLRLKVKENILDNKLDKNYFNLINFYLINNNRNYQIVLFNIENNTTGLNVLFSDLIQSHKSIDLRNLQENNGQSEEIGQRGESSRGDESDGERGESGQGGESGEQGGESGGEGGEIGE